jgi:isoleucyl-tRNA synthetase
MALVRILVPVMPHQAEDIWQSVPEAQKGGLLSILLSDFPVAHNEWNNEQLADDFSKILKSREVVTRAIEPLRADKKVGSALEVGVYVKADDNAVLKSNEFDLADIYIVSQAKLTDEKPSEEILNEYCEEGYTVWVVKAKGEKCCRCWKYRELNSNGICPDCAEAVGE